MNRADFQRLANDRIADARALLAAKRWAAAYYLVGYAVVVGSGGGSASGSSSGLSTALLQPGQVVSGSLGIAIMFAGYLAIEAERPVLRTRTAS